MNDHTLAATIQAVALAFLSNSFTPSFVLVAIAYGYKGYCVSTIRKSMNYFNINIDTNAAVAKKLFTTQNSKQPILFNINSHNLNSMSASVADGVSEREEIEFSEDEHLSFFFNID